MDFLENLLASTRRRIEEQKGLLRSDVLEQRVASAGEPRDFAGALRRDGMAIIAEIKRSTPAAGVIAPDLNAGETARAYARGGAAAISVLTEPEFFSGSFEDLEAAIGAGPPVLRKDFVIDEWQLLETRAAGADAVLLIARILEDGLDGLVKAARALRLYPLVEVFDEHDMAAAAEAGADLIGINNRDLQSFEVDPERTARLASSLPEGALAIGFSGVTDRSDVKAMEAAGMDAALVGEALVTAVDPEAKLKELRGES